MKVVNPNLQLVEFLHGLYHYQKNFYTKHLKTNIPGNLKKSLSAERGSQIIIKY